MKLISRLAGSFLIALACLLTLGSLLAVAVVTVLQKANFGCSTT